MPRATCHIFLLTSLLVLSSHAFFDDKDHENKELGEGGAHQTFAIEPADRTAIIGSTVVLPCRVLNKSGAIQWTRDDFGLGSGRDLQGYPRYDMVGSDDEGDFSLQISGVTLDDDGRYQCQVGAAERSRGIRSRMATLTVYAPPQPPIIAPSDIVKTTAGMTVELECVSKAGKPPAELTWMYENGDRVIDGLNYKTFTLSDGKRMDASLRWTLVAGREHDGKTFTCRAENSALTQPLDASVMIEVLYPPEVNLQIRPEVVQEGEKVEFYCEVAANPPEVTFRWFKDDEVIENAHSSRFVLNGVTRVWLGRTVGCEATNKAGTSRASRALDVVFGPVFLARDEAVSADEGHAVSLSCGAEGNPTPEVVWTAEGSERVLSTEPDLIIPRMAYHHAGRYICTATVAGVATASRSVDVLVKGPPKVRSPTIQYGIEGARISVECSVTSVPPPTKVLWSRYDRMVGANNNLGYEIIQEEMKDGVRNRLIIHNAKAEDFGAYNCTVWNEVGRVTKQILVKNQDEWDKVPLVAVVATILLVAVLLLLVILLVIHYRRKAALLNQNMCAAASEAKLATAKMSDAASNSDSDIKTENRTGSSLANMELEFLQGEDTVPKTKVHNNNGYGPFHPHDIYMMEYPAYSLAAHGLRHAQATNV